jgi:hypothetical protein
VGCRYTWIDDLYYFAKQKQVEEKAAKAQAMYDEEYEELEQLYQQTQEGAVDEQAGQSEGAQAGNAESPESEKDLPEGSAGDAATAAAPSRDSTGGTEGMAVNEGPSDAQSVGDLDPVDEGVQASAAPSEGAGRAEQMDGVDGSTAAATEMHASPSSAQEVRR